MVRNTEWLMLLLRLEGGRRDGGNNKIEAEAGYIPGR
jgi:hypothetical protein